MLIIEDQVIYLTRGDNASLQIDLTTDAGEAWTLGEDDALTLALRALPTADAPVLMRVPGAPGSDTIPIRPEDTAGLEVGQYSADIQLITGAGQVLTVWPRLEGRNRTKVRNYKNFVIMSEVNIP